MHTLHYEESSSYLWTTLDLYWIPVTSSPVGLSTVYIHSMEFTHGWWKHSAGFNIHTMGTCMSAHISWSQLRSWWTWFTWQSGELGSEGRFWMGSAASFTSDSNAAGWGGEAWSDSQCLFCWISQSNPHSTCLDLAHSCFSCVIQIDSDWTSTHFIICFHLTESHFMWQRSLSTSTQHECAGPIYSSQSLWVVQHIIWCLLCLQMPGRQPLL